MSFDKLKISVRLAFGFATVLFLLILIASISDYRILQANSFTQSLLTKQLSNERLIAEWVRIVDVNLARFRAAALPTDAGVEETFKRIMTA